jgi:NADPH:quinone reductase-like Zn-dependent oxidoreductase
MKAVICTKYGPPEFLEFVNVEKPVPNDNEVLVKVHAASLNAADLDWVRGTPMIRIAGPFKPSIKILGSDMAGRVEAVGRAVEDLIPGDEVFADLSVCGFGAFAEHVCVPEELLTRKFADMTFEQAATLPQAAILAVQGLLGKHEIQPGQRVLINGAGGGVGTFAVQIAKTLGAEVTGVDSQRKLEMIRSIGADHVMDYRTEDYTKSGKRYDLILDVTANRSIFAYRRALRPGGVFVVVGGTEGALFQVMVLGSMISIAGSRKMGVLMWKPNREEDLLRLMELFEGGTVKPVIDRCFPLSNAAEALRYLEDGKALGKVVLTVADDN